MLTKLGTAASFLAAILLIAYVIGVEAPRVEAALVNSVQTGLDAEELEGLTITADGRDIQLSGELDEEFGRSRAEALAKSTSGVRSVTSQIDVGPPPPDPVSIGDALEAEIAGVIAETKVDFVLSRAVLTRESVPAMDQILAILEREPNVTVEIQGYTDNSGSEEMNRELSQMRAESVVEWLAARGIDEARMSARGFGPEQPIASNDTREGRATNRRVEFVVTAQP